MRTCRQVLVVDAGWCGEGAVGQPQHLTLEVTSQACSSSSSGTHGAWAAIRCLCRIACRVCSIMLTHAI